jgi:hypothetical protein
VRALAHASFRGAWASTLRTTFSFTAARKRVVEFEAWAIGARAAGFSPEDPEMVLGVTDERLVAWRKSFFLGRPTELSTSLPIDQLYEVSVVRHGLLTGVSFVTARGGILEVEALRGRRLRHLAHEARAAMMEHRRRP